MLSLKNKSAVLAMGAALSLTLAACGGSDEDTTASTGSNGSESAPSAEPTPVAEIDTLSGEQTAVTLDPTFVEGITGLGLTPGVLGGASFDAAAGRLAFPISGGNVTYFDPNSGVTPYVQGLIEHDGSGLSLTGGGKTVELTDFVVDPAESVLTGRVVVDGEEFAPSAPLFFLDGSTLNPLEVNEADGTAVLEGTTVSLTKTAADALTA